MALSADDITLIQHLVDARLKSSRHEADDHLDRGLSEAKIKPSSTTNDVLYTDSTGTAVWGTAGSAAPAGAAGGDLTGSYPNPTIKASVALSGSPTTTTQSAGDNSTKIATTAFVAAADALDVHLAGAETITGQKTLTVSPLFSGTARTTGATLTTSDTTCQIVNTSGGAFTLTLPSAPAGGQMFWFFDSAGSCGTNALTVARGGADTINGSDTTITLNTNYGSLCLRYVSTGTTWEQVTPTRSAANPAMDGTAAAGTSFKWSASDHVHPTDTSRAPLASPALTGTPTAPTAAVDTNTTQLATTAFVLTQIASGAAEIAVNRLADGNAYDVLTTNADGVTVNWTGGLTVNHLADGCVTSAKILDGTIAGGDLSSTIALPNGATATTQSAGDNTTKVATTAFVAAADALDVHLAGAETITGRKTFNVGPAIAPNTTLTSNTTLSATSAEVIPVDTSGGAFTVTLPASPTTGQQFLLVDVAGSCTTNVLTIARNGNNINGAAANGNLATNYGTKCFYYQGSSGWFTHEPSPADGSPAMDGTAAAGTSRDYARWDHVHPTDTSRAPLASPTFTGDPKAPTPATDDNDTSIATTAYVIATSPKLSTLTAQGDLYAASGSAAVARLAIGANGQSLGVDTSGGTNKLSYTHRDALWAFVIRHSNISAGASNSSIFAPFDPMLVGNTGIGLTDGTIYFVAVAVPYTATITGVNFGQVTQGAYTADNNNYIGLYSTDGTTLTLRANTTNDGTLWKAAAGARVSTAFSAAYSAAAGIYYYALLYNSSAQTTAPAISGTNVSTNGLTAAAEQGYRFGTLASQASLPSTQAVSGITWGGINIRFAGLY